MRDICWFRGTAGHLMKMRDCPSGCGTVDMYVSVLHGRSVCSKTKVYHCQCAAHSTVIGVLHCRSVCSTEAQSMVVLHGLSVFCSDRCAAQSIGVLHGRSVGCTVDQCRHLHIFFKVKVFFLKYTHCKEHNNCFKMVLHLLIYLN